jgi:hypothetical protein
MGKGNVMKVYRSKIPLIGGLTGVIAFFLVGLAGVLPENHAGVSGVIVSGITLAFSIVLCSAVMTNRLVVTNEGIVFWHSLKRRSFLWSSVRSFEVGAPRGLLPWPGLILNSASGRMRIDSIVGTRSFVEKVAADLRMFQHGQSTSCVGVEDSSPDQKRRTGGAGVGSSSSRRSAADADELLAEGFGRD